MEELIKFETGKLAYEKGFNIPQKYVYDIFGEQLPLLYDNCCYSIDGVYPKCTQTELQKWLRDNHELYVNVVSKYPNKHYSKLHKVNSNGSKSLGLCSPYDYESYEEAMEIGLIKSLELI